MLGIKTIRVNYMKEPCGVERDPQFGWILEADGRAVRQTGYRLQIAGDRRFEEVVYDSGRVESGESAHVYADGFQMRPLTRYYVRGKVWDNRGEESAWGEAASFVSACLTPGEEKDWKGSFVTAEQPGDEKSGKAYYVRKEFCSERPLRAAYMVSSACGLYQLWLNGKRVGNDEFCPGWTSYKNRILYQINEVTDEIREGRNAVGALVGAGWYKGRMGFDLTRAHYGETTAFFGELHLQYEDGTEEIIATDESWEGCDSPILFSEIYDGETYDARRELPGWCSAGRAETEAECGTDARENAAAEERAASGNEEAQDAPGAERSRWHGVRKLEWPTRVLVSQPGCRVREITELPAKEIIVTPEGDTVIDFGQNLTGWIHIRVSGKAGDEVVLRHFETLDADGNVYLANLRSARELVTYICSGRGEEQYHPHFSFQGFQYVRVEKYPGEIKKENFTAYAVHSDMEETGGFSCSNPDLNQLWHNIKWGLKGNFLDIPTDCPQRDERLGWTGDAQIFCRTASYLMNTYPFFRKWLADVAAEQTEAGGIPHVVPDILTEPDSAAAWADVAVIAPWTLYLTFGDKEILREQYACMKKWIEFMRAHYADGTWSYAMQYGDWVALDAEEGSYHGATPDALICAAYFAYSTKLFASAAKALGEEEDYQAYRELYERLREDYRRYFMKDGHVTVDTQTAQIVSLYFGLVREEDRERVTGDLLRLLEAHGGHLVTGFVGTPYFCHALSMNGCTEQAYELLLKDDFPSWLYQVKMGATTVWEHWDGKKPDGTMWSPDMNSFNHYAYGAIGEWMYRVIAGIEALEEGAGYKRFLIQPHLGGALKHAEGTFESVYGTIRAGWSTAAEDGAAVLEITIPHNTQAQIWLEQAETVTDADGLCFVKAKERAGLTAEAGSGTYRIAFQMSGQAKENKAQQGAV